MSGRASYHPDWIPRQKGPNGRGLCKRCNQEVPKGSFTWCSGPCVNAYLDETDPRRRREAVLDRDGGVCRLCRLDTVSLRDYVGDLANGPGYHMCARRMWGKGSVRLMRSGASGGFLALDMRGRLTGEWNKEAALEALAHYGYTEGDFGKTLWEADHIVEQIRGGGHDLGNLRTLCTPCHRKQTTRLAGELARERRTAKTGQAELVL